MIFFSIPMAFSAMLTTKTSWPSFFSPTARFKTDFSAPPIWVGKKTELNIRIFKVVSLYIVFAESFVIEFLAGNSIYEK